MAFDWNQSPGKMALVAFAITATVAVLVNAVAFGTPWEEAVLPAVGAGVGVAVVFFLYPSVMNDSG